jgi:hypothetical protein
MRIELHKLSEERHRLIVIRENAVREEIECETRSYLVHDLVHLSVEAEASREDGFWGNVARGKSLAQINDRSAMPLSAEHSPLMQIEYVVARCTALTKGVSPDVLWDQLEEATKNNNHSMPPWLSAELLQRIHQRLRRLLGQWKATAFGETMTLVWPLKS